MNEKGEVTTAQAKIGENNSNTFVSPERLVFARNFSDARKKRKLSQHKIHEITGFAQSWISEVETGKSTINVDNMARLASVVGQPLWKLLKP